MAKTRTAWARMIAHADMDAFYAAIEQMDDTALRGRPVLVGAPGDRAVVLTASYEARPFGVGSAMPMARARRLCPDAVVVPPRFERYKAVSAAVMRAFAAFSPQVEAISLDEAFLDMTGAEPLFGDPAAIGRKLKQAVREATGGLTASVGLSGTKYVAKVASAHRKPDGLTLVAPDEARGWLAPFPISRLWGVGPKTEARLHRLGFRLIGDVAAADPDFLAAELGSVGRDFHDLAHGRDPRPVIGERAAKSIGSEATLERDVSDGDELRLHLRRAAEKVGARLRRKGLVASGVRVKLKTADFRSLTRQRHLRRPTDVADSLYTTACELLEAFDHPGPFRLVGVAAFDLAAAGESGQMDLFAAGPARSRSLETAIDDLAGRYGADVLRRAEDLRRGRRARLTPNLDFLEEEEDEPDSGH